MWSVTPIMAFSCEHVQVLHVETCWNTFTIDCPLYSVISFWQHDIVPIFMSASHELEFTVVCLEETCVGSSIYERSWRIIVGALNLRHSNYMNKTEVEGFGILNSIRPTIMFTMEQEDGNLPFLDSLLHRKDDKTLGVSVYRSQLTQTNTCISSPITLPTWRETWSPSSSTKLGPLPRTRMQPNTSGWSWRGMITQKHFWTQPTGPVQQHSQLKIL